MTWAQRLKRVFDIDIQTCRARGGAVRVIACIQEPAVIGRIRAHLEQNVVPVPTDRLPHSRAPPRAALFD